MGAEPKPPQEFFDLPLNLYGWNDDKENYRIIADLIPKSGDTAGLIDTLDEINQILAEKKLPNIFDGTIDSLKYFVNNHGLDINKITNPVLKEVVEKHLNKPELSKEIKMNPNRWSGQALRCKAVLIGLYIKNGKFFVTKNVQSGFEGLNEFDFPVFDDDIENGHVSEEKLAQNAGKVFESSETHEKRLLLKMALQNLELKDKKALYDWIKPFDKIAFYTSRQS